MRPTGVRIHLLSFGPLRSLLPEDGEWRELPTGSCVGDLLEILRREGRFSPEAMRTAAVAVNESYASPNHRLADGEVIALLPPVSGGSEAGTPNVAIVHHRIDTTAVLEAMKAGSDGAVCVFDGIVRNNTRGRQTLHLEYEAYESMALKQMHALRAEALDRFGVREVALHHRLGHLPVGETSVLIAVASAHRGAAFDACRWLIDTLKKTVPIWKHEHFVDGAVWADGEPFPEDLAEHAR